VSNTRKLKKAGATIERVAKNPESTSKKAQTVAKKATETQEKGVNSYGTKPKVAKKAETITAGAVAKGGTAPSPKRLEGRNHPQVLVPESKEMLESIIPTHHTSFSSYTKYCPECRRDRKNGTHPNV
jgi:hypothetical protein